MDTNRLNDFSKQIFDLLSVKYPDWIQFAEEEPDNTGDFFLKVRSPIEEEAIWLTIYTDADPGNGKDNDGNPRGEVTWQFDGTHSHSGGVSASEAFKWLVRNMKKLLSGELVSAANVENGRWHGSTLLTPSQAEESKIRKIWMWDLADKSDADKEGRAIDKENQAPELNRIVSWTKIYKG
jgi:hypothetical protein